QNRNQYQSLFHEVKTNAPKVTKQEALNLIESMRSAIHEMATEENDKTYKNKYLLMKKIGGSLSNGDIEPEKAVLMAVDLALTDKDSVSSHSWERKGVPEYKLFNSCFLNIKNCNETNENKNISNFLRNHYELTESTLNLKKEEANQITTKL